MARSSVASPEVLPFLQPLTVASVRLFARGSWTSLTGARRHIISRRPGTITKLRSTQPNNHREVEAVEREIFIPGQRHHHPCSRQGHLRQRVPSVDETLAGEVMEEPQQIHFYEARCLHDDQTPRSARTSHQSPQMCRFLVQKATLEEQLGCPTGNTHAHPHTHLPVSQQGLLKTNSPKSSSGRRKGLKTILSPPRKTTGEFRIQTRRNLDW